MAWYAKIYVSLNQNDWNKIAAVLHHFQSHSVLFNFDLNFTKRRVVRGPINNKLALV